RPAGRASTNSYMREKTMKRSRLALISLLSAVGLLASTSTAGATQVNGSLTWAGGTQCGIGATASGAAGSVVASGSIGCNWNMGSTDVEIYVNANPDSQGTLIADSCPSGCQGNNSAATQGS